MDRFSGLLLLMLQCIYITSGARLPDVRGSKFEEEIIKSRNPKVIGGVSNKNYELFLIPFTAFGIWVCKKKIYSYNYKFEAYHSQFF